MYRVLPPKNLRCILWLVLLMGAAGNASGLSDPTAPIGFEASEEQAAVEIQSLRLASVIVGPKSKMAIINGKRYRELDHVGEYRLMDIQPKVVTLKKGETIVRLSLFSFYPEEL